MIKHSKKFNQWWRPRSFYFDNLLDFEGNSGLYLKTNFSFFFKFSFNFSILKNINLLLNFLLWTLNWRSYCTSEPLLKKSLKYMNLFQEIKNAFFYLYLLFITIALCTGDVINLTQRFRLEGKLNKQELLALSKNLNSSVTTLRPKPIIKSIISKTIEPSSKTVPVKLYTKVNSNTQIIKREMIPELSNNQLNVLKPNQSQIGKADFKKAIILKKNVKKINDTESILQENKNEHESQNTKFNFTTARPIPDSISKF